jgi:hypothetical protein
LVEVNCEFSGGKPPPHSLERILGYVFVASLRLIAVRLSMNVKLLGGSSTIFYVFT